MAKQDLRTPSEPTGSLHRTPELHRALHAVAEGHVVHHSGLCAHPEGWSWSTGAHMPPVMQQDLDVLRHARLIGWAGPSNPCGNPVSAFVAGIKRLASWNARWPKAGAA